MENLKSENFVNHVKVYNNTEEMLREKLEKTKE